MTSPRAPEPAAFERSLAMPWRVAFVVYALGMTTGTHWPRLTLGPEVPVTDKTIHFLAFGGLMLLLWHTRWIRPLLLAALVTAVWTAVDELTQGIPILHRQIAAADVVSSALGVTSAAAWIAALGPVGGPAGRRRHDLHRHAYGRFFARARTWAILVGLLVACGAIVAIAWLRLGPSATRLTFRVTAAAWLMTTLLLLYAGWRRECRRAATQRPCFACGAGCAAAALDTAGRGRCAVCNAGIHGDQWSEPALPAPPALVRAIGGAVLLVAAALGAAAWFLLVPGTGSALGGALRAAGADAALPVQLDRPVDLTLGLLAAAAGVRIARQRLARRVERADHEDAA